MCMWFGYRSCAPQSASLGAPWWRPSSTPWVGLVARTRVRSALVAPPPLGPKSYLLSLPGNLPPGGWLPTALSRPALGWGRGTGASPGPWSRPRQVQEGGLGTILSCVLGRRPGGFGSPWGGLSGHRPLYHPRFHLGASRLASGTMPTTFVLSPLRPRFWLMLFGQVPSHDDFTPSPRPACPGGFQGHPDPLDPGPPAHGK